MVTPAASVGRRGFGQAEEQVQHGPRQVYLHRKLETDLQLVNEQVAGIVCMGGFDSQIVVFEDHVPWRLSPWRGQVRVLCC
jgi:hypothetical protein